MSVIPASVRAPLLSLPLLLLPAVATGAETATAQCASAYENAQLLRQRGKLVDARDQASVCARDACPEVARKDCAHWAEELGRAVPSVVVVVRDEAEHDVGTQRLLVDGVPHPEAASGRPFELDPGAHVFRVERPDAAPVDRSITIYQGERDRLVHITVPRTGTSATPAVPATSPAPRSAPPEAVGASPSSSGPSYTSTAIVGGLTVVSLGLSAYLGLTGRYDLSNLRTTCAPTCTDAQVSPVRTRLTLSDVALGAGIVGAAITVYLFVHARSEQTAPRTAMLRVGPISDGAAAFVGGTF